MRLVIRSVKEKRSPNGTTVFLKMPSCVELFSSSLSRGINYTEESTIKSIGSVYLSLNRAQVV